MAPKIAELVEYFVADLALEILIEATCVPVLYIFPCHVIREIVLDAILFGVVFMSTSTNHFENDLFLSHRARSFVCLFAVILLGRLILRVQSKGLSVVGE